MACIQTSSWASLLSAAPNNGFIGGARAGYSRTFSEGLVLAAETDMQWVNATTTVASSPVPGGGLQAPMMITRSRNRFGATQVRLGITPTRYMLIYGTGGLNYKF